MNKLSADDRARILHLLYQGSSIRAVMRLTGTSKNTVAKLLVDAGKACAAYHDDHVRDLRCRRIQVDEIWSFTYAKPKNIAAAKAAPEQADDTWTWAAIDADTKLVASWVVGGRHSDCAIALIDDLRGRLANCVHLTSGGYKAYLEAVEGAFGDGVDYAQLVRLYGAAPEAAKGFYSPVECIGAHKNRIGGNPDPKHVSTSPAEHQDQTMRMHMRRFTRPTNAFSNKVENHVHAVALHFMYYNFVRVHKTLRITPAMAAGVSDRLWEIGDIVMLVNTAEARTTKRRSYTPRNSN